LSNVPEIHPTQRLSVSWSFPEGSRQQIVVMFWVSTSSDLHNGSIPLPLAWNMDGYFVEVWGVCEMGGHLSVTNGSRHVSKPHGILVWREIFSQSWRSISWLLADLLSEQSDSFAPL
jgi:hypothetical protein